MKETLKLMKSIITGKEQEKSEKELIKEYQNSLSPNILAYFYCNNFGLIWNESIKFKIINNDDKASFCLQQLDKALLSFDINSNIKFMTYFIKCYENELLSQTNALNYAKRKSYLNSCELMDNIIGNDIDFSDMNIILEEYNLTNEEKYQCKLLNAGYTMKEISVMFKVSTSAMSQKISKIRKKILLST